MNRSVPAAFRRLCVETQHGQLGLRRLPQPPSGGCVLKLWLLTHHYRFWLPAAFRRLCVETSISICRRWR